MEDKEYLLSICIPTFNRARYLDKNLEFLSQQKDVEKVQIVISDNCSTDNTFEIVEKYNNLNIKYYKQKKNIGFDNNLENLPLIANGKYVWFLGDDDIIAPNGIIEILRILSDNPDLGLCYVNQKPYLNHDTNDLMTIKHISSNKMYIDGKELFIDVTQTIQFLSAIVVNRLKMKRVIVRYKSKFSQDRHFIQILDVISNSKCYFVHNPLIYCDYIDDELKKNKYDSSFNWVQIFFEIPNIYVRYAQDNLGYAGKHLLSFQYFQNKQFLKTYIHSKKNNMTNEISHIKIKDGNRILFGNISKIIFIISYVTPVIFLRLAWNSFIAVRKFIRGN
jgi:glycosyltransferase involved in cell wall biosynthesis